MPLEVMMEIASYGVAFELCGVDRQLRHAFWLTASVQELERIATRLAEKPEIELWVEQCMSTLIRVLGMPPAAAAAARSA